MMAFQALERDSLQRQITRRADLISSIADEKMKRKNYQTEMKRLRKEYGRELLQWRNEVEQLKRNQHREETNRQKLSQRLQVLKEYLRNSETILPTRKEYLERVRQEHLVAQQDLDQREREVLPVEAEYLELKGKLEEQRSLFDRSKAALQCDLKLVTQKFMVLEEEANSLDAGIREAQAHSEQYVCSVKSERKHIAELERTLAHWKAVPDVRLEVRAVMDAVERLRAERSKLEKILLVEQELVAQMLLDNPTM